MREEILSDQILVGVGLEHILTGQKTSLDIGEEVSNEVTVIINRFRFIKEEVYL